MATIEKRTDASGTTTYRVKVRLRGHPVQTATFKRLTDAKKWGTQTEAAIREGRHFKAVEAQRHTVRELCERYIRDVLPTKAAGTQPAQKAQLEWWVEQIGGYVLAHCTAPLIAEHRDKLTKEPTRYGKRRSPATVTRYLAVLSHAFTVARKEWQWTETNPVSAVTAPKEPRGRVRFLSDDERDRLLKACRESTTPELYPIVVLALSTGMRSGEVLSLTWDRVDLKAGRITLEQTKNGERRAVPIVGHAAELLRERAKVRRLDTNLLFPSKRKAKQGQAIKPISIRNVWLAAVDKARIEDFRFHDLRHSAASYMLMNGASIGELAEVLGHKTLQMVKRYSHLSDSHTRELVERMNAAVFGKEGGQ